MYNTINTHHLEKLYLKFAYMDVFIVEVLKEKLYNSVVFYKI